MKPLCIDLFCGLGGWTEGFLAEGWNVIGFDIERHDYGSGGYPGQLVIQDVLTLDGAQFKGAACIVASPPCQAYSYMAMPWTRARKMAAGIRQSPERIAKLNALFDACFRIQREASAAAGRYIPLIVENVKGAQPWVGRAKGHFGSFFLWGDIDSVGDRLVSLWTGVQFNAPTLRASRGQKHNPDGTNHGQGSWFKIADSKNRGIKAGDRRVADGTWTHSFADTLAENVKLSGRSLNAGPGKWRPANGLGFEESDQIEAEGVKCGGPAGDDWFAKHNRHEFFGKSMTRDGTKHGRDWFPGYGGGFGWDHSQMRQHSSKSPSRKAASAQIAKIPFILSLWIARCFKP